MGSKRVLLASASVVVGALLVGQNAISAEPEACKQVRMADPGWTDITATNAVAGVLLGALGYEQKVSSLSVPITYVGMQKSQIDVFLGNWMPAQKPLVEPILKDGGMEVVRANLPNAKFTLAVPGYVADAGVKTFADLAKYADKFDRKIYGIESGAPANQNIKKMLEAKSYGLEGWSLVESSEQSMLSQVARKERGKDWIVFLAWEPHQMNTKFQVNYLDGDKEYFGPNFGSATVNTVSRKGYAAQCPNVGRLFSQMEFTVDFENKAISEVLEQKIDAKAAGIRQLKANPKLVETWLTGVKTYGGEDGLAAVKKMLAQN
ncbi:glycine betaine/proline transport system substrate-binding protein [Rhodoferax ferrireducens]|uniref:Glycine betaine/proline transport system substrate-binding protein n=1 Tax=Rhodoferax ferrireducens TaxID=192843 RepID=A0ABU2C2F7_9BURK|nr:choline ABC transporter substrate-binding protein [Rhodoferax ferrireducens]MDR7375508.1 glycine betaine/proline transport system substrate-binding protein [Rhodoferax ferrireducens]